MNSNCSITSTTTDNPVAANSQNSANTPTAQNAENGAKDAQNPPDALIKDLYKTHEKDAGAVLNGKNRKLIDKYFD